MSKPEGIPQDIWDVAHDVNLNQLWACIPDDPDDVKLYQDTASIARAIMAAKAEQKATDIGVVLALVASHERNGATAVNPFIDAYVAVAAIRKRGEA